MGNHFTKLSGMSKAVLLFLAVAASSLLITGLHSTKAAADGFVQGPTGSDGAIFLVKLSGGSGDQTKYTVTAQRSSAAKIEGGKPSDSSLTFQYLSGGAVPDQAPGYDWYSNGFYWGGDNSTCINNTSNPTNNAAIYTWTFTVKLNGQQVGTKNEDYCGIGLGPDPGHSFITVTIPVSSTPTQAASFSGILGYTAPDGTNQPFHSNSVVTLTNNATKDKIAIPIKDDGSFSVSNIAPGTYTLTGSYAPIYFNHGELQGGPPYNITGVTETFASGQKLSVSLIVGLDGKTTSGTLTPDSATSNCPTGTDSDGNCNPTDDTLDCGSGDFNWAVCPVIDLGIKASQTLDNFIMNTLNIDVGPIFDQTTQKGTASNGYYVAWNSFRVIASAILLVAGLVMVASQALGFEILDAYTIRKTLPRLLVAIIGISLSWPLMRFTVSLFDTVGLDLRELMYAPFKNFGGTISVGGGILSTLGAAAAIMVLGPASLTFIVTIGLAVFVGFATLVIREVAIVMLIIVAPVAIACSVLPNTQKLWNLWRENFLGLMLMFPIISGLIAAGHIFSAVALANGSNNTSGSLTTHANGLISHVTGHNFLLNFAATTANNLGSLTAQALALIAYFLPYFLIPMAARLATGIIGNLAGMVNDRGRGIFDRMKKARGAATADRLKKAQNQQLWDNNSKMGKFGNKMATWATDPLNNAAYYGRNSIPGLKKRGRSVEGHIEHARLEQSKKLLEELNPVFNDKAYRAINGGLHGKVGEKGGLSDKTKRSLDSAGLLGKTPQSLSDLNRVAQIMGESDEQTERLAGNAIHGMSGRLATLYQDPEMGKASVAAAGMMGLAAHGFLTRNDMSPSLDGLKTEGGAAFAQTIGTQSQLLVARSRPDLKAGYSMDYNEHTGKFQDGLTVNGGLRGFEMFATLGPSDIAGAKGGFFKSEKEGGSGDIMEYILKNGRRNDANVNAEAVFNEVQAGNKADFLSTPAGIEKLKVAESYKHYDSVRKSLIQNAGQYAHGSIDAQTLSADILRKAGIAFDAPTTNGGGTPPRNNNNGGGGPMPGQDPLF